MMPINRTSSILWFIAICCVAVISVANAQNAPPSTVRKNAAPALLQQMVGTWNVQQRMWPGFATKPVDLPPAVARRRLVEGVFQEEVMESADKSGQERFTRTAYF